MLEIENSSLVVVDVQGKLARIMYEKELLLKIRSSGNNIKNKEKYTKITKNVSMY